MKASLVNIQRVLQSVIALRTLDRKSQEFSNQLDATIEEAQKELNKLYFTKDAQKQ